MTSKEKSVFGKLASTSMDSDLKIWRLDNGSAQATEVGYNYRMKFGHSFNLVSYSPLVKWVYKRYA